MQWVSLGLAVFSFLCCCTMLGGYLHMRFQFRQDAAWRLVRFAASRDLPEAGEFMERWKAAGEPKAVEKLVEEVFRDELSPPLPPNVTPIGRA